MFGANAFGTRYFGQAFGDVVIVAPVELFPDIVDAVLTFCTQVDAEGAFRTRVGAELSIGTQVNVTVER